MTLVDSNVLMYAVGAEHPFKSRSLQFLRQVAMGRQEAAIDAEVLQEVLHRYRSLRRWEAGMEVYDLARRVFPLVVPIRVEHLDRARLLMDSLPELSARDALRASVVLVEGFEAIASFDSDFDRASGVRRIEP